MALVKLAGHEKHDVYVSDASLDGEFAYVCFSAWSKGGVGVPFGHRFFESNKIPAYYVIQRENVWYTTPDIYDLAEVVKNDAAVNGRKLVLYGASMGGYGALHLRNVFGAVMAVAIAPQLFVHPENCPKENRWPVERTKLMANISAEQERSNWVIQAASTISFFDPHHLQDGNQFRLMDSTRGFHFDKNKLIEVPHANHDVARALVVNEIIQPYLINFARGKEVDLGTMVFECAGLFKKDVKAFLNYYRLSVLDTKSLTRASDRARFNQFMNDKPTLDFEGCYMAAEIYGKLDASEEAVEYSTASLKRYPGELPQYLIMKHQFILKRFGLSTD